MMSFNKRPKVVKRKKGCKFVLKATLNGPEICIKSKYKTTSINYLLI